MQLKHTLVGSISIRELGTAHTQWFLSTFCNDYLSARVKQESSTQKFLSLEGKKTNSAELIMRNVSRYFQDMAALDFCLVVGMQDPEENFGVRMGSFSMDIGQLSDNHPTDGTIPVFERSGVHLASITVRISLVYSPETPITSATEMPILEALPMNVITSFDHFENPPLKVFSARGNVFADARGNFTGQIATPNRPQQLFVESDVPLTGTGHPLLGSANINDLIRLKRLLTDVPVPPEDILQMRTSTAIQSPRKQLIFYVEVPLKRQLVKDGDFPSATQGHLSSSSNLSSPRLEVFRDELSSSSNLTSEPALQGAVSWLVEGPSLSLKSARVSPPKALMSRNQRRIKLLSGKKNPSTKFSGPQLSSPDRIHPRSPKRRASTVKNAQQSSSEKDLPDSPEYVSEQMNVAEIAGADRAQFRKVTTDLKRRRTHKAGKVPPNPKVHSESSPEKSQKVPQKSLMLSTIATKTNTPRSKAPPRSKAGVSPKGSRTNGKSKSFIPSRPREEEEVPVVQCNIHSPFAEAEKSIEQYTCSELDLVKEQRQLDFPDMHNLSGNPGVLPEDMVEEYLEKTSAGEIIRETDDALYQESVHKLIQQIVGFRATLTKSSVSWGGGFAPPAETDKLNKTNSTTLVKHFKQLDENIGSVNRLLNSLLAENNVDLPQYATVAQTEILEDDPNDVAEAALVEELFFPKAESEFRGPSKPRSRSQESSADTCEIHNKGTPKKQGFVEDLLLRYCEPKPTVPKIQSTKPLLESLYDTQNLKEKIPALNLCLTLTVGKLTLLDSTLTKSRGFAPVSSEYPGVWSAKQNEKTSSCLLTISFPGLNHSKSPRTSLPEQSITISPTQLASSELYFGNESQLHWKNVKMESLDIWKSERMIVRAFLNWEAGQSLTYEGSVVLNEVFDLMPNAFQTKLSLFKVRQDAAVSEAAKSTTTEPEIETGLESCWDEAAALMAQMESTPAGRLEIGIDLLIGDMSGKARTGEWLYVAVSCVTGSNLQPSDDETTGHLLLIVKSDLQSVCQIPFYADWRASPGHEVKAWRPLKGSHPDEVLRGPRQTDSPFLYIEVWRKRRSEELIPMASSNNLIGLVKVPLKIPSKGNEGSLVVAEGDYYIWNPFKDVLCGSVEITVVMGPEAHMLKLLQQNRAARIIQSHAPCPKDGRRAHASSSVAEYNPFRNRNFQKDRRPGEHVYLSPFNSCNLGTAERFSVIYFARRGLPETLVLQRKTVKHVIEVTVQHATDLPETAVFPECEGTYIKYLFPCDEEAFYTQTMEWSKTIHFSASVHHGIILPTSQRLDNHFKDIIESPAQTGDLIFELWGCYASWSGEKTYPPNVMELNDSGVSSNWDMGREPTCKHGGWDPQRQEILIGTAKLLQWSLLGLIAAKPPSSPEVRKRFYLPIQLESSQLSRAYTRAPSLAVEVTYFILDKENKKDQVQGTIFSEVTMSEDTLFEGVVEFDIVSSKGLQDAEEIYDADTAKYFTNGVNSYVRYSLFRSNEELTLKYPPCLTPVQPNSYAPHYDWTGRRKITLIVQVLEALNLGHMSFEVWHHHFPRARRNLKPLVPTKDSLTHDILLGTALIPTRKLLESKQGTEGWHDLISRKGKKVGAINVHVYFKQWQVRPLRLTTETDTGSRGESITPRQEAEGKTSKLWKR